jgi:hypothetical protein
MKPKDLKKDNVKIFEIVDNFKEVIETVCLMEKARSSYNKTDDPTTTPGSIIFERDELGFWHCRLAIRGNTVFKATECGSPFIAFELLMDNIQESLEARSSLIEKSKSTINKLGI